MFDIPIGLFIFKRTEKSVAIIERIKTVKPTKIYLIGDAGRNDEEQLLVEDCREKVEAAIDWNCEINKDYAERNRGCFENIGLRALNIFSKEDKMIFLEDDNLPEESFFGYCKYLLEKYEDNEDILWICGTNYLSEYESPQGADYVFTQHMLPCGWASWSKKFTKYYDAYFKNLTKDGLLTAKKHYNNKRLFRYDKKNWFSELKKDKFSSWDYQMNFSIRFYNKLGIAPCKNQITNIGVDTFSAHGGTSMENYLTNKFCMVPSSKFSFPLRDPSEIKVDKEFERKTQKIIVPPFKYYFRIFMRRLIPIPRNISISKSIKNHRIIKK